MNNIDVDSEIVLKTLSAFVRKTCQYFLHQEKSNSIHHEKSHKNHEMYKQSSRGTCIRRISVGNNCRFDAANQERFRFHDRQNQSASFRKRYSCIARICTYCWVAEMGNTTWLAVYAGGEKIKVSKPRLRKESKEATIFIYTSLEDRTRFSHELKQRHHQGMERSFWKEARASKVHSPQRSQHAELPSQEVP